MIISFIKGKKAIQTYLALCKKSNFPLNHKLTLLESLIHPTSPELLVQLNQEITKVELV